MDSRKAAKKYNLNIDPEDIRPLWDPEENKRYAEENLPLRPLLKLFLESNQAKAEWPHRYRIGEGLVKDW